MKIEWNRSRPDTATMLDGCRSTTGGGSPLLVLAGSYLTLVNRGRVSRGPSPIIVPNGNRIVLKLEHLRAFNPTGSMYDRVYSRLLEYYERRFQLRRDQPLIEGSVGNAGAAFAWACRERGYSDYTVITPEDIHAPRVALMKSLGSRITFSPPAIGPSGYVDLLEQFAFRRQRPDGEHIEQRLMPITKIRRIPSAPYRQVVREVIHDLDRLGDGRIDRFVFGVGSGNTISQIGRELKARCRATVECAEFAERPFVGLIREGRQPPIGGTWVDPDFIAGTIHGVPLAKLNLDMEVIDQVTTWDHPTRQGALTMLKSLSISAGQSSSLMWAAAWDAAHQSQGETIFTIIFDDMSKYDSSIPPVHDIEVGRGGLRCSFGMDAEYHLVAG